MSSGSVRPLGFEPKTYGLENRCSIQLSYGRILRQKYKNITKTQTKEHFLSILLNKFLSPARIYLYHRSASRANDVQVSHRNYYFWDKEQYIGKTQKTITPGPLPQIQFESEICYDGIMCIFRYSISAKTSPI